MQLLLTRKDIPNLLKLLVHLVFGGHFEHALRPGACAGLEHHRQANQLDNIRNVVVTHDLAEPWCGHASRLADLRKGRGQGPCFGTEYTLIATVNHMQTILPTGGIKACARSSLQITHLTGDALVATVDVCLL